MQLSKDKMGYIFVALGIFFLLTTLGVFRVPNLLPLLMFFGIAYVFFYYYNRDKDRYWWSLIPGFTLLGLGFSALDFWVSEVLFLTLVGAGFIAVYLNNKERWWAIIPGGVLMSIGLAEMPFVRFYSGEAFFFLGLAATFVALYRLPNLQGKHRWARYPAFASLGIAALITLDSIDDLLRLPILPVLFLAVGGYLLWSFYSKGEDKLFDGVMARANDFMETLAQYGSNISKNQDNNKTDTTNTTKAENSKTETNTSAHVPPVHEPLGKNDSEAATDIPDTHKPLDADS